MLRLLAAVCFCCSAASTAIAQTTLSSDHVDFGGTYYGLQSLPSPLRISNSGPSPVVIFYHPSGTTGDFRRLPTSTCAFAWGSSAAADESYTLPGGASCTVNMQFTPSVVGAESTSLRFDLTDTAFSPIGKLTVALTGSGLMPVVPSPTQLDFGYVLMNRTVALPITLKNNGGLPVYVSGITSSGDFSGYAPCYWLAPAQVCSLSVAFQPSVAGTRTGNIAASITSSEHHLLGEVIVPVRGIAHALAVTESIDFGVQLIGTTSESGSYLYNSGATPITITGITFAGVNTSGSPFTAGDVCGRTLLPIVFCRMPVSFTPGLAKVQQGTISVVSDDFLNTQVTRITGAGTAAKLTSAVPVGGTIFFGQEAITRDASAFRMLLTNVSQTPLVLDDVVLSTSGDFSQKNNCGKSVAPGATCTIALGFSPVADGERSGTATLQLQDPAGPQTFVLNGLGVGIGRSKIYVHYDYMVASDHTHDPELTAPGALQRVIEAFAAHGIELIIDPKHTAIPEVDTVVFDEPRSAACSDSVLFSQLKKTYFTSRKADEHYAIFAHNSVSPMSGCDNRRATGNSVIPGTDFVISLASRLTPRGYLPQSQIGMITSAAFMHELGHNLGFCHAGCFGMMLANGYPSGYVYDFDYPPNYLSVMNYRYGFFGIPQGEAVGSAHPKSCVKDADCDRGSSCIDTSPSSAACYRLDYSGQVLPTGGNTPGLLDEFANLDEPAGLGSGTSDLFTYNNALSFGGQIGPTTGPIDWDGDGAATNTHATANIDFIDSYHNYGPGAHPWMPDAKLPGWNDWVHLGTNDEDRHVSVESSTVSASRFARQRTPVTETEPDEETLREHHLFFPIRPANLMVARPVLVSPSGTFMIALLGTSDFDVHDVEISSLESHGARPVGTAFQDVNGDGMLDLVITLRVPEVRLSPRTGRLQLSGWLKSSQAFVGEEPVILVQSQGELKLLCQE